MVIGSTADFGFSPKMDDTAYRAFLAKAERMVARFMLLEEARFLGPPQCEPLGIFGDEPLGPAEFSREERELLRPFAVAVK